MSFVISFGRLFISCEASFNGFSDNFGKISTLSKESWTNKTHFFAEVYFVIWSK